MSQAKPEVSSEVSVFKPTTELSQFFAEPALIGQETPEVYRKFCLAIASSIKPTDVVGWILTNDVAYLSWEIRRERIIKADIVKHYQKEIVAELIQSLAPAGQFHTAIYRIFVADDNLTLWATDLEARVKIDAALADKGHTPSSILAQAYIRGALQVDAVDRRIAGYERRRDTALSEAGLWNDRLVRLLNQATTAVLDGEFTEAQGD